MGEALLRFDPYLDIAAVFINFIFIILVLVRTSRGTVYIIFSFVCVSVMYWSFCSFLAHVTGVRNWFYLSQAGAAAIPTFTFHFIVALVRPGKSNRAWLIPAYSFSFLLGAVAFLAPVYPKARNFIEVTAWDISYLIFLSPLFFGGLMVLLKALKKAGSKNEKSRLWYFLIAGAIGLISAVTDHVQTLKVPVPALGHIGSVFYPAILVLGIFKHRTAYDILAQTQMKLDTLNELAAGIAHEIRNPLGSIKGAARLLANQMENSVKSEARQYLVIIAEEIDRLDNILSNG
jgi:signal transduction histidine kinase